MAEPLLFNADCLDVLPTLKAASIDAVVSDPPAGIAFMGKSWDSFERYEPRSKRGREVAAQLGPDPLLCRAREVLFGLSLSSWLDGKKAQEYCAELVALIDEREAVPTLAPWARGFVAFLVDVFSETLRVVKPGAHLLAWALPRTSDLTMLALRLAGWEIRDSLVHLFGGGFPKSLDVSKAIDKMHGAEPDRITENTDGSLGGLGRGGWNPTPRQLHYDSPKTEDAKRHAGKGTALSPGHEQWILARAPLTGTVARNVLEYGTGAINIDACRTPAMARPLREYSGTRSGVAYGGLPNHVAAGETDTGRWPKNVILSCSLACEGDRHTPWCPVAELDRQSGRSVSVPGDPSKSYVRPQVAAYGSQYADNKYARSQHNDDGGASRFFPRFGYHAKASDRSVPGREDITNKHPTHKSPELMRWLVRLITPPGGTVLDMFLGSGTTGVAAIAEGGSIVGIERDTEHFEVARARILAAVGSPEYAAEANAVAPVGAQLGLL